MLRIRILTPVGFLCLAVASAQAPQIGGGNIDTIAGNGNPNGCNPSTLCFGGDGGPSTQAIVNFSIGDPSLEDDFGHLAVDVAGNLYFADKANQVVRKIDTRGIITTIAGTPPGPPDWKPGFAGDGGKATSALLNYPAGVAIDGKGNLYIAEEDNNRVRKIDANGIISTVAGSGAEDFGGDGKSATSAAMYGPSAVAVDAAGNLYIADTFNDRVRMVNAQTGIIQTIAGNGQHGDNNNQCNNASAVIADNVPATSICLGWPSFVLPDNAGSLYISDHHNNVVRVMNLQNGLIRRVAGTGAHTEDSTFLGDGGPALNSPISFPMGLALDAAGNLYIADMHNDAIRKVTSPLSPNATISTPVAIAAYGFGGDGQPAWGARLAHPTGLAIDAGGNMFIGDWYNQRIRRVSPGSSVPRAVIFPGGLVNGASFAPAPARVAPGSIVSIFGRRLAPGTALAGTLPLPTTLLDQKVSVNVSTGGSAMQMPLFFVSPDQINAQLPAELPAGGTAAVTVKIGNTESDPITIGLSSSQAGIFTYGSNRAVAINQDGTLNSAAQPAPRGSTITVYLTGQGALNPPVPTGQPAPFSPLSRAALDATAIIGGQLAAISFLGATPGFVGLSQANIVVPNNAPAGDQQLALNVGGQDSNRPVITVK